MFVGRGRKISTEVGSGVRFDLTSVLVSVLGKSGKGWSSVGGSGNLLLGEPHLSGDGLALLGERNLDGLGEVGSLCPVAVLVSNPVDDIDEAVGADVLVGSSHDDDLAVADQPHLADGGLLDAVLGLEGVVVGVGRGQVGAGGVVDGGRDGDRLGEADGDGAGGSNGDGGGMEEGDGGLSPHIDHGGGLLNGGDGSNGLGGGSGGRARVGIVDANELRLPDLDELNRLGGGSNEGGGGSMSNRDGGGGQRLGGKGKGGGGEDNSVAKELAFGPLALTASAANDAPEIFGRLGLLSERGRDKAEDEKEGLQQRKEEVIGICGYFCGPPAKL